MSWLDRVLAVPAIGVRFRPWFKTTSDYVRALEPLFEAWAPNGETDVQAQVAEVQFHDTKGFHGRVTSKDIVVQFMYRPELKEKPGDVPQLEYPVAVQRFTALLERTEEKMAEVCHALLPAARFVEHVGIVADAKLERAAPPPGVERFLAHLGKPWVAGMGNVRAQVTGTLERGEGESQRCHHFVGMPEKKEDPVFELKLDFQRFYDPMRSMTANDVVRTISSSREAALAYFDRFGKGDLNYE